MSFHMFDTIFLVHLDSSHFERKTWAADSTSLGLQNERRERKKTEAEKGQVKVDSFFKKPRSSETSYASSSYADPEQGQEQVQEQLGEHNDCPLPEASVMDEQDEDEVSISPLKVQVCNHGNSLR